MSNNHPITSQVSVLCRYPRLDDQAVFWKVIRTSVNPPVLPLGTTYVVVSFYACVQQQDQSMYVYVCTYLYPISLLMTVDIFESVIK